MATKKKPYEQKELAKNLRRVKKKTMTAQGIAVIIDVYIHRIYWRSGKRAHSHWLCFLLISALVSLHETST